MISNESKTEGKAAFGSIAHGGGHARVRYRNYDIGLGGCFARELTTESVTTEVHGAPEDEAVRAGEINVLENAARLRLRGSEEAGRESLRPDDDQLARLHVALVGRANQIKGGGFGGKDNCLLFIAWLSGNASHGQGTETARVARRKNAVRADHYQRERTFDSPQGIGHSLGQRLLARLRNQVNNYFRVAVGLKN